MRVHVVPNPRCGGGARGRARASRQRTQRGLRALPAVRCRPLPRALRLDADRADRPAAPLHVDLARVRPLRAHRRVPLVRDRLHEPAAAPPRRCRTPTATSRTCATSRRRRGASRPSPRASRTSARYAPSGRLLDVGCHVGTFIELAEQAGYDVEGVEPSRWAAKRAEARVRGPVRRRRRRGRPAARGRLRRGHDVGRHRAPARPGSARCARCTRRCGRAGSSRSRRWTSRRSSRASPAAAGRGTCRCTSSTSPAARSASCCAAAASRSSRSRATAASCASPMPSRAWAPTAARRSASRAPLTRPVAGRTVGVDLGDIVTVVARKPEG